MYSTIRAYFVLLFSCYLLTCVQSEIDIVSHLDREIVSIASFGSVLGFAQPGNVAAYSCDYSTSTLPGNYMNSSDYVNYVYWANRSVSLNLFSFTKAENEASSKSESDSDSSGALGFKVNGDSFDFSDSDTSESGNDSLNMVSVYSGIKYQCVEFARRWLIVSLGISFGSIDYAFEIFSISKGIALEGGDAQVLAINNKNKNWPKVGDLLIWNRGYYGTITGHVAVVLHVEKNRLAIGEQNFNDVVWPEGQQFARYLTTSVDLDGNYIVDDTEFFMGWVRFSKST